MAEFDETLTIKRAYFDTLVRRARLHEEAPEEGFNQAQAQAVTISKVAYDRLVKSDKEYTALRRALVQGGVDDNDINLIIQANKSNIEEPDAHKEDTNLKAEATVQRAPEAQTTARPGGTDHEIDLQRPHSLFGPPPAITSSAGHKIPVDNHEAEDDRLQRLIVGRERENIAAAQKRHPAYGRPSSREPRRTIIFTDLPAGTTFKDVVDVVRGGIVFDMYLRHYSHSAKVSFVEAEAAQRFLEYAQRCKLRIRGQCVTVQWTDDFFSLPAFLANQIAAGATRNLLLQHIRGRIAETNIREDLQHIERLLIIEIKMDEAGDTAMVSLNSIMHAISARSYLISLRNYAGIRVTWAPDECAQPLPLPPPPLPLAEPETSEAALNLVEIMQRYGITR